MSIGFLSTTFREGYSKKDVDAFLTAARATLESCERVPGQLSLSVARISSHDVMNVGFQPTRFRSGYDQDHVDTFLDRIVEALRQHESSGPPAD